MPELGESVTEGVITQWLKSVGDTVAVDEALLEVSTDKVDTEVPSPIAGTIVEILFEEDDTVEVGDVIARIGDKNAAPAPAAPAPTPEPQPEPTPAPAAPAPAPKPEPTPAPTPAPATPAAPAAKVNAGKKLPYVTPLVRKLADKHGIDLTTVTGTGIGGRIRKQDVLAAAAAAQAPAAAGTRRAGRVVNRAGAQHVCAPTDGVQADPGAAGSARSRKDPGGHRRVQPQPRRQGRALPRFPRRAAQ